MNALIVDDDPIVCMLASKMLEVKGYSVKTVSSENDLDEFLSNNSNCPDIILLDLQVGDATGTELLEKIMKKYNQVNKIVCMSSHTSYEAEDLYSSIKDHLNFEKDFIQKPFQSKDLYEILELV